MIFFLRIQIQIFFSGGGRGVGVGGKYGVVRGVSDFSFTLNPNFK